jgi:hypothetical protein
MLVKGENEELWELVSPDKHRACRLGSLEIEAIVVGVMLLQPLSSNLVRLVRSLEKLKVSGKHGQRGSLIDRCCT